jgi:general secretion pathway protein D
VLPPPDEPTPAAPPSGGFAPSRGRVIESYGVPDGPAPPGPRPAAARTLPVVQGERLVQFAYEDVEVVRVVREVVGDVLGLPLTIDSGVAGRMSFRTPARVPISDVPRRLDLALQPLGYGLAAVAGRVRVGRIADLDAAAGGAAAGSRFVPLRYVQPSEVVAAVQASLPEGVRVAPDPGNSGLVISGPGQGVDAAEQLVRLFDVDALRGRSFLVYPLVNATAASVARELETIFSGGRIRVAPVERLNAVLVVTDQAALLPRVRRTLAQLDTASDGTVGMQVFPILNRRANEVADLLAQIFAAPPPAAPARASPAGGFGGLSLGQGGSGSSGIAARPPAGSGGGGGAVPSFGTPNGEGARPVAAGSLTPGQFAAELGLSGPVRVQADMSRNAVVVLAAPQDFRLIAQTIRRLDQRPRQVFIEAMIAEVRLNDELRFGIDYAVRSGDSTFRQAFPAGLGLAPLDPIGGGFTWVLRGTDFRVTLQALSSITDVRVVSAPRMLVVDNETATLQVGDQVPVLTQVSQSTTSGNAPIVNSVELRDTGVILAVRARIGAGGVIALDVFQEVSDAVRTTTSGINSPTIQLRRLQSTINVMSGETVALGGLMRDRVERGNSGIPILNQIPYLGLLFGSRSSDAQRTELLVMLAPRVIDDGRDMQGVTEELRARITTLAPDVGLMITPRRGVLPPAPPRGLRLERAR